MRIESDKLKGYTLEEALQEAREKPGNEGFLLMFYYGYIKGQEEERARISKKEAQ